MVKLESFDTRLKLGPYAQGVLKAKALKLEYMLERMYYDTLLISLQTCREVIIARLFFERAAIAERTIPEGPRA